MSYYTQQQPPVRVPPPQGYPPKHAYPPPGYPAEGYAQGYPPQQPPRKETGFLEGCFCWCSILGACCNLLDACF